MKPAIVLKLLVPFFTPRFDKGKWNNYYIFPVIEKPSNLKRIHIIQILDLPNAYVFR